MYNDDTEILFPSRVIPSMLSLRGGDWNHLVDKVIPTEQSSHEHLAFVLMMIKLGGCSTCNADSFRGMRGCTQCSKQTIKRFRGDDEELILLYNEALIEVIEFFPENN
jgi:hypothetical protein